MNSPSEETASAPPIPPQTYGSPRGTLQHAKTLSEAGWHAEAIELLKGLAATPTGGHPRFRIVFAEVLLTAGLFEEAERITVSGPLPADLAAAVENAESHEVAP